MLEINRAKAWHGRGHCLPMRRTNKPHNGNSRILTVEYFYAGLIMKIPKSFTLLTAAMMPLLAGLAGFAQTDNPSTNTPAKAPAILPSSANEVVRLVQSGVGDEVVVAFIGQSHSSYNLSGADITALKETGVSPQVLTAMLNHDSALRAQEQASSPVTATAITPQPTVTQPAAVSATAIANQTPAPTVITQSEPPPPLAEVVPVSPGPDYLWTPGGWSWNGGAWIWIGGRWHYPVRPGHVWVGGYWGGHGRGRGWVRGHWR